MRYLALATLAAAAATLAGAPAFAQTIEELTVTGHALKNQQLSKSRVVSFADLDLTRPADRQTLRMRVADTAGDVCEELNEPGPAPGNLGRSCQEIATRNALADVKVAVAAARGSAYAEANLPDSWYAPAAETYSSAASATVPDATYTTMTVTNGPVADTPENRARHGAPLSHAGKRTAAKGN
ncbi:MAG: UrcA family protein [Phenylobacterium sp.]